MKRMTFPIVALVFSLFFSGRPLRSLEKQMACIGDTLIYGSSSITITKIEVTDLTLGGTTTYNSPSFPVSYSNYNSNVTITEYFSDPHSGNIRISHGNEAPFFCLRFDSTSTLTYNVHLDCDLNVVQFANVDAPVDCN